MSCVQREEWERERNLLNRSVILEEKRSVGDNLIVNRITIHILNTLFPSKEEEN
jgi:hypothetical protein